MFQRILSVIVSLGLLFILYIAASRLDVNTIAMVLGIIFGIFAGIPIHLLFMFAWKESLKKPREAKIVVLPSDRPRNFVPSKEEEEDWQVVP